MVPITSGGVGYGPKTSWHGYRCLRQSGSRGLPLGRIVSFHYPPVRTEGL